MIKFSDPEELFLQISEKCVTILTRNSTYREKRELEVMKKWTTPS